MSTLTATDRAAVDMLAAVLDDSDIGIDHVSAYAFESEAGERAVAFTFKGTLSPAAIERLVDQEGDR